MICGCAHTPVEFPCVCILAPWIKQSVNRRTIRCTSCLPRRPCRTRAPGAGSPKGSSTRTRTSAPATSSVKKKNCGRCSQSAPDWYGVRPTGILENSAQPAPKNRKTRKSVGLARFRRGEVAARGVGGDALRVKARVDAPRADTQVRPLRGGCAIVPPAPETKLNFLS